MEKYKNSDNNIEKLPEGATDIELAIFLVGHIDNPCGTEIQPGQIENIREFYINEAEKMLGKMTNPDAKKLLELKIQEYKK
jgi:hypothetical protein